ncbi:hypothetical protein [Staphylococcus shinii]|uniref:hypothetical protein n=1 Tax=Staphylococcus shinii TaxID=2912228 RepID=UPI003F54B714
MSIMLGTVLSSSVIVACITYIANTKIKNKELLVKIKLEEQNKWIKNINDSMNIFVKCNIEYFKALLDYSNNQIEPTEIPRYLLASYKAQHALVFYVNQNEFNEEKTEEIMDIIESIVHVANSQNDISKKIKNKEIEQKDIVNIEKKVEENETELGESNVKLAKKIGELAKYEKKALADEVIDSKFMKVLIRIFR